ncbi:MAG: phospholipid transport system substrate-binding protein [Pseudohongiellaceae bacterium]|jgi:phospholipid transport system substrate-binding protein|nr:ABC transporter substrate-binding protein [Pseudomonadota bacterium]MDA1289746.1 ABC transporter substrate-binding protein [Pseudomonadota bacterium]
MKSLNKFVVALAFAGMLPVLSYGQEYTAVETAEIGVMNLLSTVQESRGLFLTDRDGYFGAIEEVLNSIVDFNAVAVVVMNRYAESASEAQKDRFADILRATLTRFYGASLVSYEGQELAFLPSNNADADPRADTIVRMELRGGDTNLELQYQMFLNENDEWKLKNLSLVGINLGRQYFTQFSALMGQNDDDIDAVLDNWK